MANGTTEKLQGIRLLLLVAILVGALVGGASSAYRRWASARFSGHYPFGTQIFGMGTTKRYASLHLISYDPHDWSALPAEAAAQGMHWSVWAPSSPGRALVLDTGRDAADRAWFIILPLP